jgi:Uma2 family endonuclease
MPISEATYELVALEDPEGKWELARCGLRRKPDMTQYHNHIAWVLGHTIQQQLPLDQFEVRVNAGRVRLETGQHYITDVMVVPLPLAGADWEAASLETYSEPLPLVAEVWSPRTGDYDVDEKLAEYKRRGDHEIWLLHPREKGVRGWRKQPDDSYVEFSATSGAVPVRSLPGVTVQLESLFR